MDNDDEITVGLKTSSLSSQAGCPERYQVQSLVGHGGMGMVFHAIDTELSRDVAIKVLFFEGAREQEAQERFMREAKVLASLSHQNIVHIFSSGLNIYGNPYHVMEYLDGIPLSKELSTGAMSATNFYSLFSQILSGLEQAHQNRIAHRDLKPSNIMRCTNAEGDPIYKLIDFGIARVELSPEQASRTITRTDAVLGSPLYISPEQCRSARGDSLSDIYSLGCIMYECIAGKPPHQGETSFETMYKHMTEPPASLATNAKSSQSIRLAALVERCLEKKPEARPQSVTEIKSELTQIFDCEPDEIDLFRKRPAPQRNVISPLPMLVASILIATIGIVAGLYFAKPSQVHHNFKITSKQEKISRDIKTQNLKIESWKNPQGIKSKSSRELYLRDLVSLGREQLKSAERQDIADSGKTYTAGIKFCEQFGNEYLEHKAAFLTLRARSEWKLDDSKAAEADYQAAFQAISTLGADIEIKIDMLRERARYCLHQRRFTDALNDLAASSALYDRNDNKTGTPDSIVDRIGHLTQALDKNDQDRSVVVNTMAHELRTMKPQSEDEALQMIRLSNLCADRLERCRQSQKQGAREAAEFSRYLLAKISGQKELKEKTNELFEKCKLK